MNVVGAVGNHPVFQDYFRPTNLFPGAPPAGPGHETSSPVACASVDENPTVLYIIPQAYRCSAEDYNNLIDVQNALNAQYSSQIITEHAFNGAGILQEVSSP